MPEPEPTKRFRIDHFPEPNPRTQGSDSGLNQVQRVREVNPSQSSLASVL